MDAKGADEVVDRIVIREHRAAVAVAAERLCGEERGGGDAPEGTRLFPVIFRAEALRRVLDEGEAVFLADRDDRVIVAGIAENVHGHDRLGGVLPLGQDGMDLPLQTLRTEGVGIGRDVAEHAHRAEHGGGLRGGDEGHVGGKHRVPLPHAQRHEGKLERVGAVGAGDAVLAAGEGGKLGLQLLDIFAADERGGAEDILHIDVDLALEGGVLGF